MSKRNLTKRSIVHMDDTTLKYLAEQQCSASMDSSIKYVQVCVPTGSEAEKKIRGNFGYLAVKEIQKDGLTFLFFPCVYRATAMDIDFFASVSCNYAWGNDVIYSLKKGFAL